MTENPKEDLTFQPEFSILEFGDGYIALIQGGHEIEDDDGQKMVEWDIRPSDLLKRRYNIRDSILNVNGCMTYKVYRRDLIELNPFDDANKKWMYIKNFRHEDTEISNIEWALRKRLEEMEKRIVVIEGENIWLYEQLQLAKSNPEQFLAQGTEIFDKFSSKFFELMGRKKDKEE